MTDSLHQEPQSLEDQVLRGKKAEMVLKSELYQEAIEVLRSSIQEQMMSVPIRDFSGLLYLRLLAKAADDIQHYLEEVLQTGKLAEIQSQPQAAQQFGDLVSRGVVRLV